MDEMNPAFENFLNNMSRLGGTPRETTRRVSASSFLGKDVDIERRVNNNSKKISIIARILKSRRANTAGIEKSIFDIKITMSSIVQTLEAQEKFEYEKFLETQQQLENEKRRKRETATEKDKPVVDFFKKEGFTITSNSYFDIASDIDIGKVDPNYLYEVLSKMDLNEADALFISCTALPALSIIDKLEKKLNKIVLSSNPALIWDTLGKIGINDSINGFGTLFSAN